MPDTKLPLQVLPQLIPAGRLTTDPLPDSFTESSIGELEFEEPGDDPPPQPAKKRTPVQQTAATNLLPKAMGNPVRTEDRIQCFAFYDKADLRCSMSRFRLYGNGSPPAC